MKDYKINTSTIGEIVALDYRASQINRELLQHMKNEEEVLFPAIKEVLSSGSGKAKATIISEIMGIWRTTSYSLKH